MKMETGATPVLRRRSRLRRGLLLHGYGLGTNLSDEPDWFIPEVSSWGEICYLARINHKPARLGRDGAWVGVEGAEIGSFFKMS